MRVTERRALYHEGPDDAGRQAEADARQQRMADDDLVTLPPVVALPFVSAEQPRVGTVSASTIAWSQRFAKFQRIYPDDPELVAFLADNPEHYR